MLKQINKKLNRQTIKQKGFEVPQQTCRSKFSCNKCQKSYAYSKVLLIDYLFIEFLKQILLSKMAEQQRERLRQQNEQNNKEQSLNKIVVKKSFKQQFIEFLKSENQMHVLNESQIQITRQWNKKEREVFSNITRLNHQTIYFHHSCQIKLQDISHIGFYYLKSLYLENLELASLQVFQIMHLKSLQQLWINNNKIICLKPFRKADLPNLRSFCINQSNCKDFQSLSQLKINKLGQLLLDPLIQQWQQQRTHYLGVNWLYKVNIPQIYSLELDIRAIQFRINPAMLFKKFKTLHENVLQF